MGWGDGGSGSGSGTLTPTPPAGQDQGVEDVEDFEGPFPRCDPNGLTRTLRKVGDPANGPWTTLDSWFITDSGTRHDGTNPPGGVSRAYVKRERTNNYKCLKQECYDGEWIASGGDNPKSCNTKTIQEVKLKDASTGGDLMVWTIPIRDSALASESLDVTDEDTN